MAVDFPNNPVDQQSFTSEGSIWIYEADPGCWRPASDGPSGDFVLKTGDTMTGSLTVPIVYASDVGFIADGGDNQFAQFYYDTVDTMGVLRGSSASGTQYYTFGPDVAARNDRIMREIDADARYVNNTTDSMSGSLTANSLYSNATSRIRSHLYIGSESATDHSPASFYDTSFGSGLLYIQSHHSPGVSIQFYMIAGNGSTFIYRGGTGQGFAPGGWHTGSSREVKTNAEPMADAVGMLKQLRGYTYDRTDIHGYNGETITQSGLYAEDVQKIMPYAVSMAETQEGQPEGGILHYDPAQVLAVVVDAVNTLTDKVDALTARVEELEGKSNG